MHFKLLLWWKYPVYADIQMMTRRVLATVNVTELKRTLVKTVYWKLDA